MSELRRRGIPYKEKYQSVKKKVTSLTQAKIMDRACERKKRYSNKNIARLKAHHASQKTGEAIEPYKCHYAKHWHIGHQRNAIS